MIVFLCVEVAMKRKQSAPAHNIFQYYNRTAMGRSIVIAYLIVNSLLPVMPCAEYPDPDR